MHLGQAREVIERWARDVAIYGFALVKTGKRVLAVLTTGTIAGAAAGLVGAHRWYLFAFGVALVVGGFLAWRDEYKKTAESPDEKASRDAFFAAQIGELGAYPTQREHLLALIRDEEVPVNYAGNVSHLTRGLLRNDGRTVTMNPVYAPRLREWARKERAAAALTGAPGTPTASSGASQ
jgi:hypothetical protein